MKTFLGWLCVMLVILGAQAVFGGVLLGVFALCPACKDVQALLILIGFIGVAAAVWFIWLAVRIIAALLRGAGRGRA